MKRAGAVLNRRAVARGRRLARWGTEGMWWWPDGPELDRLVAASKKVLASPRAMESLGRWAEGRGPDEIIEPATEEILRLSAELR